MTNFELLNVGDEAEIYHTITDDDVSVYVKLTGDDNPLHVDEDFASKTKFGKRIVHGMLSASFISTLIGTKLPGKGALWYEQHTKFIKPVYIGERIKVWGKVLHKSNAIKVIKAEIVIYGQDGRKVITCEAKIALVGKKEQEK